MESWVALAPIFGIAGLVIAGVLLVIINKQSPGNEKMREIAAAINEGAMVFLRSEYSRLAVTLVTPQKIKDQSTPLFLGKAYIGIFNLSNWSFKPNSSDSTQISWENLLASIPPARFRTTFSNPPMFKE